MPSLEKLSTQVGQAAGVGNLQGDSNPHRLDSVDVIINDEAVSMDHDERRDQMTAQVKATKLRMTSWASIQVLLFLFIAYCSK